MFVTDSAWRLVARVAAAAAIGGAVGCGGGGGPSAQPLPVIVRGSVDLTVDVDALRESIVVSSELFAPDDCAVVEGAVVPGVRRLLRFDTVVVNHGELPMVLGSPGAPQPPLVAADFEFAPCHQHWHFLDWCRYELQDGGGNTVGTGHKQSFCMLDTRNVVPNATSLDFDCDFQGISSGWADVYDHTVDGQWVDVTDVPSGDYRLVVTINFDRKVVEADDRWPDTVSVDVHIP